jgi:glycosyltransferase involved in cell wall biosynthesis
VLYTGGFDPRKRVDDLLEAFATVRATLPDARLVITGRAPLPPHPGVELPGFLSDDALARLYGEARVVAYPSALEGFGFPVLEAFGSGTPVVALDVGSIPEVAGGGALLVPDHAPQRLAEALLDLLRDDALATRLGAAGRAHASGFRWTETARMTLEVYRASG